MNRLDRFTSILIQLQSKRLITAREIAERFEVSIRTIYRDIQTLRLAGVPIGEEEGKGYFLVEGYRLPPVMFATFVRLRLFSPKSNISSKLCLHLKNISIISSLVYMLLNTVQEAKSK